MKIQNTSTRPHPINIDGRGVTLAPGDTTDVPDHVALDLAASFPDRFTIIDNTTIPVLVDGSYIIPKSKKER